MITRTNAQNRFFESVAILAHDQDALFAFLVEILGEHKYLKMIAMFINYNLFLEGVKKVDRDEILDPDLQVDYSKFAVRERNISREFKKAHQKVKNKIEPKIPVRKPEICEPLF